MTEHPVHPDDELVELALGDVGEPRRSQLIRHLVGCSSCRMTYKDAVDAVDAVLPAAPRIPPPVGFDQRVLTAIGGGTATPHRRPRTGSLRVALAAAAAAVIAAVTGGVVALTVSGGDELTGPALAADAAPLRTSDGSVVGTAAVSTLGGDPVVIVSIARPAVGIPYHCRVILDDGRRVDAGRWTVTDPDGSTWISRAPPGHVVGMDLVTDDGRVWSSARIS